MNNYQLTFNRAGEITKMETKATTHYQAILNGCGIMAKRYGVSRDSMIRYFSADKQNVEWKEIKEKSE